MRTPYIIDDEGRIPRVSVRPETIFNHLDVLLNLTHLNHSHYHYLTAIHVPTQEEYDALIRVYEIGGWRWQTGELPTRVNRWRNFKEKTCIEAKDKFGVGTDSDFRNHQIITPEYFYSSLGISTEKARGIAKIFDGAKILAEAE